MNTARFTAFLFLMLLSTAYAQQTAAPPSANPKPPAAQAATPPDYRLVPGDKLRVEVYKDQQLSQSLQIRPDGKITLPLLGDMMLGKHPGRTSDDQITGLILRGDGVQFTAVGERIYRLCRERGLGVELPRELFLQDEKYIP